MIQSENDFTDSSTQKNWKGVYLDAQTKRKRENKDEERKEEMDQCSWR